MNARELRLWHWRAALSARARARRCEERLHTDPGSNEAYYRHQLQQEERRADFHTTAVQVFDDFPGLEFSTAEQDAVEDKPHRLTPHRKEKAQP